MPGAPNRPPENAPAAPPPPPVPEDPAQRIRRRLVPSRIALNLDVWRGAPSAELIAPLERAEAAFAGGDWREADSALDALSIRFAEPRWTTLPEPFRELRVSIPAPQPPQWDPDFGLAPAEKDARRARREAETQIALVRASIAWAKSKTLINEDPAPGLETAANAFIAGGSVPDLYSVIDPAWVLLAQRVPMPKPPAAKPAPPRPAAEPTPEEA